MIRKGIVVLIACLFPVIGARAFDINVHISGGIEKIDGFTDNGVDYVSYSQLGGLLNDIISWDMVGFSVAAEIDIHRVKFYLNSPYINIDDTVKNVIYPATVIKGRLYLPAETFLPLYDLLRPERISWESERRNIRINSDWYNITDAAISAKDNGLLIEIFVSKPLIYEIYISEGDWLNITIPEGTVNIRQLLSRKSSRQLRDMNVFQFESSAQVSFRLRRPIKKYSHHFQVNPGRIQVSIIDEEASALIQHQVAQVGPDDKIDKIIIDAGHGGSDYGAIGLKKTREKEIVLDIAKRLARLIRKEKLFEVVMTRDKDVYVSLDGRAKIANKNNGDIFVSIHANASPKRSARGFQVFFLAPANNNDARAAAQLENATFLAELHGDDNEFQDDISYIISDMIQTEFQVESADLAAMVDKELRRSVNKLTKARGMDQAGFLVLNRVYMPSVLVEAAFLTNKKDEKLLKDKKYRQKVAEAIYAGLKRFKKKYENKP
jgi:N-acetylmuramoyl-L-alanine amidase